MERRLFPAYAGVIPGACTACTSMHPFPRIRGGDPWERLLSDLRTMLFPAHAGVIPVTGRADPIKRTFPHTRGGDLKGKRRMVFLPGRLVTDRKAAADEKSGCTNSTEKVCARLHVVIYEILYYHKSASDLSLVRRGGTPKIRFFPVEFPTVHLMRIER